DRQARDGAHLRDCALELAEVEERLDHEEVDSAAFEDARALRVLAGGADGAGDEDVAAGDLAGLPGELDGVARDPLEVVLEEVLGEPVAARSEGVRLDQVGAGPDVAEVDVDDALGRAQVRLLGASEAPHGACEDGAHAAVGNDRGPGGEAVEEAA